MKRSGYKALRRIRLLLALAFSAAAAWLLIGALLPLAAPFLADAAAFSAALAMPEATAAQIAAVFEKESSAPAPPESSLPEPQPKSDAPVAAVYDSPSEPASSEAPPASEQEIPLDIPKKYRGSVLTEDMSGAPQKTAIYVSDIWLRNDTSLEKADIAAVFDKACGIRLENTVEPQVLIYHTHATESFCPYDNGVYDTRYNWRSTDNNINMVAVGEAMAAVLRENGIGVIHDTAQHDYPSYNGSYANSYRSAKDLLAHYPTIKVVLDLHRDAIERDGGLIVKPTAEINGEKYAQLMIVSNCDDKSGLIPNWRENLRFARAFSLELESAAPGISRPLLFSYRKYNQQLSTGALLLEFGSHANTLEEARRTAVVAGKALSSLLLKTR